MPSARRKAPSSTIALTLAALVWAFSPACGLVSFDVSQDIPAQTIMGSPIGALVPVTLFALPLDIDLQSETAAHGTGPAKSANLSSLTLTIASPTGETFDFLSTISVSVSASAGGASPEVEIAKLQPIPASGTISVSPVPGVDLLPYIRAGASIKATVSGHLPAKDTTVVGKVIVTVHV